jgi:hypothetical protein
MLILVATVAGAKAYTARDNTVAYWALDSTVAAGDRVTPGDLVATRVRLSARTADRYLLVSDEFPAALHDLVWARAGAAGALVERSSMIPAADQTAMELPLNVATGSFPIDIGTGDRVDVWVGPAPGQPNEGDAMRVLHAVRVESTGDAGNTIGSSLSRTILVGVDDTDLTGDAMSSISAQHVTLVRVR